MDTTMVPLFVTIKNSSANEPEHQDRLQHGGRPGGVPRDGDEGRQDGHAAEGGGISIPAGGTTMLKPGGDHVMLMGLKQAWLSAPR